MYLRADANPRRSETAIPVLAFRIETTTARPLHAAPLEKATGNITALLGTGTRRALMEAVGDVEMDGVSDGVGSADGAPATSE